MNKKSNAQKYILFILVSVFIMGTLSGCADDCFLRCTGNFPGA